jgi:hypothetical protein
MGHDFFIGKSRLWLAERAKYRGSHGGAPETGFKRSHPEPFNYQSVPLTVNPKPLPPLANEHRPDEYENEECARREK